MQKPRKPASRNSNWKGWKRRLIGAWIFAVPIALLMIAQRFLSMSPVPEAWAIPLLLVLGFPVVFIFGFNTLRGGLRGFISGYFNMDSLIALGTVILLTSQAS